MQIIKHNFFSLFFIFFSINSFSQDIEEILRDYVEDTYNDIKEEEEKAAQESNIKFVHLITHLLNETKDLTLVKFQQWLDSKRQEILVVLMKGLGHRPRLSKNKSAHQRLRR